MYVINPEVGIISYYRVYLGGLSLYSLLDPLYSLYTPTSSLTPPLPPPLSSFYTRLYPP